LDRMSFKKKNEHPHPSWDCLARHINWCLSKVNTMQFDDSTSNRYICVVNVRKCDKLISESEWLMSDV
jgi:hypothetical protein